MATPDGSSNPPSRHDTPDSAQNSRFTASANTTEEVLKSQTVGLVNLSDFRKRRAEAQEAKDLGRFVSTTNAGTATPSDG
jgi:protein FAM50